MLIFGPRFQENEVVTPHSNKSAAMRHQDPNLRSPHGELLGFGEVNGQPFRNQGKGCRTIRELIGSVNPAALQGIDVDR